MNSWPESRLADIADIRISNVDKKSIPGEVAVQLCNYTDAYENDYITASLKFMEATAGFAEIERFRVDKGDVLLTKDSETPDDIGIPAVVVDDIERLVCGYHLALIKPKKDQVHPVYLAKQLGSRPVAANFARLANGSTRYGLTLASIANTPVRLAPIPVQTRIAEILSTLDEAIEQTEALIAKHQQIKAGLMHDLFTRGVTPDGRLRPPHAEAPHLYKPSPLGLIPKEWDIAPLLQFSAPGSTSFVNGPFGSDLLTSELTETGVPVIYVKDIKDDGYRRISTAHVSEEKANVLAACNVRTGDVLIAKVGDPPCMAAPYWGTERSIVTQDVMRIRPADEVDTVFLAGLLNSPVAKGEIKRIIIEGTRARVSLTEFKRLRLPKPQHGEQKGIGKRLEVLESMLQALHADAEVGRVLKYGLMQDLLTGRVPVKVGEQSE